MNSCEKLSKGPWIVWHQKTSSWPKITNAARHLLFREGSKGQSSSRDLQKSQNLPITPRRVYQLLHDSPNLVYWNGKIASALTAKHKKIHVDWVKKKKSNIDKGEMGKPGCFLMRKKFNLDGPMAPCVLHDLRKEKLFSKDHLKEDLLWFGVFSASGKADLVVMEGKQNCLIYQCVGKNFSHLWIV